MSRPDFGRGASSGFSPFGGGVQDEANLIGA
jgi:hypothetical protein